MSRFSRILQLLNKPFPERDNKWIFYRNLFFIGLFVSTFLYIFQPFDFYNSPYPLLPVALGYGLITFVAGAFFQLVFTGQFWRKTTRRKLTLGRWICQISGIILTISLANFFFARYLAGSIEWQWLPKMIFATFAIGIFPVSILGTIAMLRQEQRFQGIAKEINRKQAAPSASSTQRSGKSLFGIPTHQIRYVEALQNYARIVYLDEQDTLTERIERATLKSILAALQTDIIVRCHRSYLVNKTYILSADGNAQGLLLSLDNCPQSVPVSRSYVPQFRT